MTNVTMATLGRIEAPEFIPQPTAKSETSAPNVEILRSFLVPKRCPRTVRKSTSFRIDQSNLDQKNWRKGHDHIDDRDGQ